MACWLKSLLPAGVFFLSMSTMLWKFSFAWFILLILSQAGTCMAVPDTTALFYENKTFNGFLDQAIGYQRKADSLFSLSLARKKELIWTDDPAERRVLQKRILEAEDSTMIYREMSGIYFSYANSLIPQESKRSPFLEKDTVLNGITVYQYRLTDEFLAKLGAIEKATSPQAEPDAGMPPAGINFRIYDRSPYSEAQTFEYDFPLPAGVFYRIQLAVYKTRLAPAHFKGLSPITTEQIPGKNLIRYFVGKFYRYQEARDALERVKDYGHKDAYIVGYYNGTKGTFTKLQELERHP